MAAHLGRFKIDDVLAFYANTHNPATGAAADADAAPSYRVYELEVGTALLTGDMALLDTGNTTGFYSESITLSAANGFEDGKNYVVYLSATVGGLNGTTHYTFQVDAEIAKEATLGAPADTDIATDIANLNDLSAAEVNAEVVDVLSVDTFAEPTGVPSATASITAKLGVLYMMGRNKLTATSSKKQFYDNAGNVEFEQDVTDDGTTYSQSQINAP